MFEPNIIITITLSIDHSKGNDASTFEFINPIHIKKLIVDAMACIPKGVLKSSMHNPNSCVS